MLHDLLLVVAGGGTVAAVLKFIEFLISHFTHKKEREEDRKDDISNLRKEMKQHLTDVNTDWKATYCDKNKQLIEEIGESLKQGLNDRERTGKERYEEHKEYIKELREAILVLTEDAQERKKLEKYMANSLLAITHDKLIYLGKTYQRRGAITLAEQNNLKLLYTPYHDGLGGNSDGEGYYNYCMHLPIVTDEEAQELDRKNKEELLRQINY